MHRKVFLPLISGAIIIFLSAATVIESAGTYSWTGSPIDGGPGTGGQCSACHNGGASGVPTLSLSASPAFGGSGTNLTYSASTTYTITVSPIGNYAVYGFNCEIINSQSSTSTANFGTWGTAVSSNCRIYAPSGIYPSCASHNAVSTTPWSFKWTAPASGTGFIYADVNGCNHNGATSGDQVSGVFSYTLTAASSGAGIEMHQSNVVNLTVFPNPASDNIRISYSLKERGTVSVKLYNLNGDLVADLLNETQEVGMQNTNTHLPSGLAKGLYMLKLSLNGEQSSEQKIMIN